MSTTVTGNPLAGADSPCPAPGKGAAVTLTLPQDGDPDNAATLFAQQYPCIANQLSFFSTSTRPALPLAPSSTTGFTPITHTGTGTGTVTPSGSTHVTSGTFHVEKIIAGGAVGTATFQTSTDGGNTFGSTQTTAASMTDGTSGVTLAFSGKPTAPSVDVKPARRRTVSTKPRTLEELAEMERETRLAGDVLSPRLETADGILELLGAERAVECGTQYGAFEGQRFIVAGTVSQHRPLSPETAKVLGTQAGVGGRFQLSREIFYGMPFLVTVLTPTAELTRHLIDLHRERQPANVIARVLVARSKNKWRGFVGLEADAHPVPFAFVVERAIELPEEDSEASE